MPVIKNLEEIKEAVLGKEYDLSLVFVTPKKMQALNLAHRGKNYATDILSFELEKVRPRSGGGAGEIFICKKVAAEKAKSFDRTPENYLTFLFIHGLCHLKGMEHGDTMERQEQKIRKQFGI